MLSAHKIECKREREIERDKKESERDTRHLEREIGSDTDIDSERQRARKVLSLVTYIYLTWHKNGGQKPIK